MDIYVYVTVVFWFCIVYVTNGGNAGYIDGCPMYGCTPSATFSFYVNFPTRNATVNWISSSQFKMNPVPNALGCVSDSASIICQSNSVFTDEQSYISVAHENGSMRWRDEVLHLPSLPLLDTYGDVTGSDGQSLVRYDENGRKYPVIPCQNLTPLFSMSLVGDSSMFLLLVSGSGMIVVRETNGVPVGFLTLNDTMDNTNGTFIPIAQPAVNSEHTRFYVLTKFVPLRKSKPHAEKAGSGIEADHYRVYAIDVHQSITNRITIGWNYTIDTTTKYNNKKAVYSRNPKQNSHPVTYYSLIFDRASNIIYVKLNDVSSRRSDMAGDGWLLALSDSGTLVFQHSQSVIHMALFMTDVCVYKTGQRTSDRDCDQPGRGQETMMDSSNPLDSYLWIVTTDSEIKAATPDGRIYTAYELNKIFGGDVEVTSHLAVVKSSNQENDTVIFAINITKTNTGNLDVSVRDTRRQTRLSYNMTHTTQTSYVVAIDTGKEQDDKDCIRWMVPVPNNMIVLGQVTGASGSDFNIKDQLVLYAEKFGQSAIIFTIH